jgi:branched-chain amino acid transport system ATP-binding protein
MASDSPLEPGFTMVQTTERDTVPLLETKNLSKAFGALKAVSDVDLRVEQNKVHAIIGPNGAGKTTLFNLLAGVHRPTSGQIIFQGRDISNLKVFQRCGAGIGRSYQITSIYPESTIRENIRLAVQSKMGHNCSLFKRADSLTEVDEQTDTILAEMGLTRQQEQIAATIPYGSQRALDVAIALATDPILLLLDEPTSGMTPEDTHKMVRLIERISQRYTVVLIEHHMDVVMSISDEITVLHQGGVIARGSPQKIQQNEDVKDAYLGRGKSAWQT